MALLDVSEVITDPLFTSPVKLVGTLEAFDENGNPLWEDQESAEVQAVVTADTKTIERLPDALQRAGTIIVRFMTADAPEDFEGKGYDRVEWRGKRFVIKDCVDYSQFGQGFYRLICWPEDADDGSYPDPTGE